MRFLSAVRNAKVPGPPQRAFTLDGWNEAHARLREDEADDDLHRAGIWIFTRFESVRAHLSFVKSQQFSRTQKIKVFISIANNEAMNVSDRLKALSVNRQHSGEMVRLDDIVGAKVRLAIGADFRFDEIVQSATDAIQYPLRELLNAGSEGPSGDMQAVPWNGLHIDVNLGIAYLVYNDIWEECLWNDYVVGEGADVVLYCKSREDLDRRIASEFRDQSQSLVRNLTSDFRRYPIQMQLALVGLRSIIAIEKQKKRTRYRLSKEPLVNEFTTELALNRIDAQEQYYDELVSRPGADPDITIIRLLQCWQVVSTGIELLWIKVNSLPAPQRMVDLVPHLVRHPLYETVSSALQVPLGAATKLVDFLIFRGEKGQDIWAQPLVRLDEDRIAPLFFAARRPNLRRSVDVWLKQMGIKLADRGDPFERHVRATCATYIAESPIKDLCWARDSSFEFGKPAEQIDLIIRIGSLVLIGDSKCMLRPAEAGEWGTHRRKVNDAVTQIKRKCTAIEKSRDAFLEQLNSSGAAIPIDFSTLPVVLLNNAINVGPAIDGVAIIDLLVLRAFFKGELPVGIIEQGQSKVLQNTIIYARPEDAPAAARDYFCDPPQVRRLINQLRFRPIPLLDLPPDIPGATLLTREINSSSETLPAGADQT